MSLASTDMNQSMNVSEATPTVQDELKIAELRNGKVIFKQRPMSFEHHSETMREIVTFRSFLEATQTPLTTISNEYLPLIAKLVHESDKTLNALAKSLQSSLVAPTLEASPDSETTGPSKILPTSVIEHAIKAVAERANYGVSTDTHKSPAGLCVWRWEAKDANWLPKSVRDGAAARRMERIVAKKYLQASFDNLSPDSKEALLKIKSNKAPKWNEIDNSSDTQGKQAPQLPTTYQAPALSSSPPDAFKDSESGTSKQGKTKKKDAETIAKENERHQKKVIRQEKEKKAAEATKRSAAVFANFFKPVGQASKSSPGHDESRAQASSSKSSLTATANEFNATFKPFSLRKDSQLAPINWFIDHTKKVRRHRGENEVIESAIHEEEVEIKLLAQFPPARRPLLKSVMPCVREIMDQLVEAEVQGDQRAVRRLNGLLKDRKGIPAKALVFAENNRPGYLGTWTRKSSIIRPRAPFVRDLLSFDYDYDSDAEWEEEEGIGEDVESQDESMEDEMSSAESEMEDWLVEGDEVDAELPSLPTNTANTTNKRKATDSCERPKKRKVVPLIPFQKGPLWEKKIGHSEYIPFRTMNIQLFNDTPFPINPFTFRCEAIKLSEKRYSDPVLTIPTLPASTIQFVHEPPAEDARNTKRKAVNALPPPKTTFPSAQVPLLLRKIDESSTNSFLVLVDSLFQEMKAFGIRKNALEVKLREVAEKCKVKKGWVVKEDAWATHGLMKPS